MACEKAGLVRASTRAMHASLSSPGMNELLLGWDIVGLVLIERTHLLVVKKEGANIAFKSVRQRVRNDTKFRFIFGHVFY